jgi:hypothetical protein
MGPWTMTADPTAAECLAWLDQKYGLRHFGLMPENPSKAAVEEILAGAIEILTRLAENRIQRGLYRRHVQKPEDLSFKPPQQASGWLARFVRQDTYVRCHYDCMQADFEDNGILLWTLHTAAEAGIDDVGWATRVRRCCCTFAGDMPMTPKNVQAGISIFHRGLPETSRPIHGLCRLILDHRSARSTATMV